MIIIRMLQALLCVLGAVLLGASISEGLAGLGSVLIAVVLGTIRGPTGTPARRSQATGPGWGGPPPFNPGGPPGPGWAGTPPHAQGP